MRARRSSGFTLLELLIVVAIIAVLATLILGGLASARRRTQVAVAKNNIEALKAALVAYEADTGKFPRRAAATATGANMFNNDIAFAYAALRNRRINTHGGGPNSPYVDWKPEQIGTGSTATGWSLGTAADFGSRNPADRIPAPSWFSPIPPTDFDSINDSAYQLNAHPPSGNDPLVFLDPWGNALVYREWASVPTATKDTYGIRGGVGGVTSQLIGGSTGSATDAHTDRIHDPSKFDIYSFGPNGVNEFGEGDDVTSWTNNASK